MYWTLYILYFGSILQQSIAILITLVMSIIKSLYGVFKSKEKSYIFFYLYSYVYTLIIIPSKIHALITLWDMEWGTRGKKKSLLNSYWSVIIWYITLSAGFAYSIYKNYEFKITYNYYLISFVCLMVYLTIILFTLILEYFLRKFDYLSNDIERMIKYETKVLNNENYNIITTPTSNNILSSQV